MIIGLTGKNAGGKGIAAKQLVSKGYAYHSLSDALRDEADSRGLDHSRDVLIKLGTELREEHGHGILAERINDKIKKEKESGKTNFVVDSIRNPGEIEELRKNGDFILVAIIADDKIRFERMQKRGRKGDAENFEQFLEHEQKENNDEGAGQQLDRCIELADHKIDANGTIEEENEEIDRFLAAQGQ